ncbi:phosphatidylcholine:diacylglycerol cholinephosphotransferase 1-like [Phragmites australis]|uniref:phosphatidylcholine:diacylglycerol cholinephosphotransferase 1-like n=1 Tax=Phragmites australis TaxID=29695 RepID=UPI002D78B03B|nr:phosphatidylcholine:diacylglycerol cholinephosphotransferase 1-like [Phragmites australis]
MPPPSLTTGRDPAAAVGTVATRRRKEETKVHPEAAAAPARATGACDEADRKMGAAAEKVGEWRRPEWRSAVGVLRRHPAPALFGCGLLLFMAVEYSIPMVKPDAPPLDLGFLATKGMHAAVAARPWLNSLLAALNTVFVAMQAAYILWAILVEQRPRAAVAALMMFTCRGLLGCATQLPLPEEFLGSGMDFPVGNVSFFLFFSGHVAGAVIAAADMRREGRLALARLYDMLNVIQGVRLLACRGHYTIDLAVGVGAGILFDTLAGWYFDGKNVVDGGVPETHCRSCQCHKALLSR